MGREGAGAGDARVAAPAHGCPELPEAATSASAVADGHAPASGFAIEAGGCLRARRAAVIGVATVAAAVAGIACWRYLPGAVAWLLDAQAVRAFAHEQGALARLMMLGINIIQVLLAFLPGEPVELASGYAFGFWEGTALCLAASAVATSIVYWAVRRWGWRVVGLFFDRSLFDRYGWLRDERRLELIMFVVFLIPGTPKDFLTYFAGLTRARFLPVLCIATVGRIPSIVTSTLAASSFATGDYMVAGVSIAVAIALAITGMFAGRRFRRA